MVCVCTVRMCVHGIAPLPASIEEQQLAKADKKENLASHCKVSHSTPLMLPPLAAFCSWKPVWN